MAGYMGLTEYASGVVFNGAIAATVLFSAYALNEKEVRPGLLEIAITYAASNIESCASRNKLDKCISDEIKRDHVLNKLIFRSPSRRWALKQTLLLHFRDSGT